MSLLTPVFVWLFHVKMTAVKKVYYTRFAQDMNYIHMLYEFNSLEAWKTKFQSNHSIQNAKDHRIWQT